MKEMKEMKEEMMGDVKEEMKEEKEEMLKEEMTGR